MLQKHSVGSRFSLIILSVYTTKTTSKLLDDMLLQFSIYANLWRADKEIKYTFISIIFSQIGPLRKTNVINCASKVRSLIEIHENNKHTINWYVYWFSFSSRHELVTRWASEDLITYTWFQVLYSRYYWSNVLEPYLLIVHFN